MRKRWLEIGPPNLKRTRISSILVLDCFPRSTEEAGHRLVIPYHHIFSMSSLVSSCWTALGEHRKARQDLTQRLPNWAHLLFIFFSPFSLYPCCFCIKMRGKKKMCRVNRFKSETLKLLSQSSRSEMSCFQTSLEVTAEKHPNSRWVRKPVLRPHANTTSTRVKMRTRRAAAPIWLTDHERQ